MFSLSQYAEQDPELAAYSGRRVMMRRCSGCGFIQPEALPALPGYFERMYNQQWPDYWLDAEFTGTYKDLIFRSILHELGRRVSAPPGGRSLLDIGAHVGRFIQIAHAAGWRAEGIELNPVTSGYARAHTGLPVHSASAESLSASDQRYDAVTLTDVLEHIPDPVSMLRTACALLAPGGSIAVKVPSAPSQMLKERVRLALRGKAGAPELAMNLVHVNHFSPHSLKMALSRAGFSEITVRVGAPELPPVADAGRLTARASNTFRRVVYRLANAIPAGAYSPLAFNLQAYARRGHSAIDR